MLIHHALLGIEIASEHLEIITKDAFEVMTKIKNAGAIFLGEYSSEPLGDFMYFTLLLIF